ncbi:hypothetical protein ABVV53_13735 [Novosphingobium sp. RD2P27]|uniref:Lipoprotein n=1 Tax=Novosphingobium kalidii TaxID=3230299 RepID=A0ABV2D3R4_9SPHN
MRKMIGLGLCLALAACVTPPVEEPTKCKGELRPANPYGVTLPSLPSARSEPSSQGSGPPAQVDVFPPDRGAEGAAAPGDEQSDASGQIEVPRLSAALRQPILSNC